MYFLFSYHLEKEVHFVIKLQIVLLKVPLSSMHLKLVDTGNVLRIPTNVNMPLFIDGIDLDFLSLCFSEEIQ